MPLHPEGYQLVDWDVKLTFCCLHVLMVAVMPAHRAASGFPMEKDNKTNDNNNKNNDSNNNNNDNKNNNKYLSTAAFAGSNSPLHRGHAQGILPACLACFQIVVLRASHANLNPQNSPEQ